MRIEVEEAHGLRSSEVEPTEQHRCHTVFPSDEEALEVDLEDVRDSAG